MPTKFTGAVSKMMYLNILRRNCLQHFAYEGGISWEYVPVLEHIKHFPGCMQADISKKLKVTAAAVTQSTQKLENAGLIEKKVDPDNLRVKRMYITEKGIEMLRQGTQTFDRVDSIMFQGFSDDEVMQLEGLLDRINKNMSDFKGNTDENHMPWEFGKSSLRKGSLFNEEK